MCLGADAWAAVRRAQQQVHGPVLQLQRSDEDICRVAPQQCVTACTVTLSLLCTRGPQHMPFGRIGKGRSSSDDDNLDTQEQCTSAP